MIATNSPIHARWTWMLLVLTAGCGGAVTYRTRGDAMEALDEVQLNLLEKKALDSAIACDSGDPNACLDLATWLEGRKVTDWAKALRTHACLNGAEACEKAAECNARPPAPAAKPAEKPAQTPARPATPPAPKTPS